MTHVPTRYQRRHTAGSVEHHRRPAERDCDRILYTDALQRLANVTQVASAGEGIVFHNRLTHTHEVAQIARRLAQKLEKEQTELARRLGDIDPDVVQAAALAHDLGHPPFGHIAEEELDRLARTHGAPEGFEGNAQSFRIVVRLAPHRIGYHGLDLTRATLNAILKYPWLRDTRQKAPDPKKAKKFGAYSSELDDFRWAREGFGETKRQSVEAAIMDVADMIAYSVHDLEDFYRAGLIPVETLVFSDGEWDWFAARWKALGPKLSPETIDASREEFIRLVSRLTLGSHYTGEQEQRVALRAATSQLINDFVHGVELREPADENSSGVFVDPRLLNQLRFLQALVWVYVIGNPRLATQQDGQRRIIRTLFEAYHRAVKNRERDFVPPPFRAEVDALPSGDQPDVAEAETRVAVDIVASLSDPQALLLYRRLTGTAPGSVTEVLHA